MSDLRDAFRTLRATPVVTVVAVLSLALGIGANTAIFSIVDTLLLRALPVRAPDRLFVLMRDEATPFSSWTNPIWEQIRARPDLFETAFANNRHPGEPFGHVVPRAFAQQPLSRSSRQAF